MGGVGCDNMTVILTCFLHGASYAELAERCSKVTGVSESSGQDFHSNLSGQSKETVMITAYHHGNDPLDLRGRGAAKQGPGIMMNDLHSPFDCSAPDSLTNSLKEPQQLSCTV